MEFLFKCDKKACRKCQKEYCTLTTDINHAVIPNDIKDYLLNNFYINKDEGLAVQKNNEKMN